MSDEAARLMVEIGAALCLAPVALGFLVTRWVKFWSRPDRGEPRHL